MKELTLAGMEARLGKVERQNRVLAAVLCIALAVGSIAVSNAQPSVLSASEVRSQRFTLLDDGGRAVDNWYTEPGGVPARHGPLGK
jgi:hypothetical protein